MERFEQPIVRELKAGTEMAITLTKVVYIPVERLAGRKIRMKFGEIINSVGRGGYFNE